MNNTDTTPIQVLRTLIGHWSGEGTASYPTYGSYDYTETLIFKQRADDDRLHYEEQALKKQNGALLPSHWETGFLYGSKTDPTQIELVNVQIGGRMEILRGTVHQDEGAVILRFRSALLLNDDRMIETTRTLTVENDHLNYTMDMATTATGQLLSHIVADLTRQQ